MKKCIRCQKEKELDQFYAYSNSFYKKSGLPRRLSECKGCTKARNKARYERDPKHVWLINEKSNQKRVSLNEEKF